jgi:hypothetical protein
MTKLEGLAIAVAVGTFAAALLLANRRRMTAGTPNGSEAKRAVPGDQEGLRFLDLPKPPARTPRLPLWVKLVWTAFICILAPVYWRQYGPANFLWFSDIALLALCAALWLESPLLVGTMTVGVWALELAWNLDFLAGGHLLDLASYMFDPSIPAYLRSLSSFHVVMPLLMIWMLLRLGYDRRSLAMQTCLAWVVLPTTYLLTDPDKNINWVFGPGTKPQKSVPPLVYLTGLMIALPLFVYLPSHLLLASTVRYP